MDEIYTENALIRYLYNEADLFEKLEVEHALETDKNVQNIFKKFNEILDLLPKVSFVPSQKTVNQILFASKKAVLQA